MNRIFQDRKGRIWIRQWGNFFASESGLTLKHIDVIRW